MNEELTVDQKRVILAENVLYAVMNMVGTHFWHMQGDIDSIRDQWIAELDKLGVEEKA